MVNKLLISAFIIVIFNIQLFASGNFVELSHLRVEYGPASNIVNVNGLYQDEKGTMWIGTKEGIKTLNGTKIETFAVGSNNWHSTSYIPTVCGDRNGHIFFNSDYQIVEYNLKNEKNKIIFQQSNMFSLPALTFNYGLRCLWIGMKDSIFSYKNNKLTFYGTLNDKRINITSINELKDGRVIIGTKNSGVISVNKFKSQKTILNVASEIISIYEDSKKRIWIGTMNDGLFVIDNNEKIIHYSQSDTSGKYKISSNYVRAICEDNNGNFWIGTMQGLDFIDLKTSFIFHYGLSDNEHRGLANLSVWIILKDDQGTMWFGTYYGGLDYFNPSMNIFRFLKINYKFKNTNPIVSKVIEDKSGNLWIGTEGQGLITYEQNSASEDLGNRKVKTILKNNIKSLLYDKEYNRLWIGTHLLGICCYEIDKDKLQHYDVDKFDKNFRTETVQAIVKYQNRIFMGTLAGVYYLDLANYEIHRLYSLDNYLSTVNAMLIDNDGLLWVAGNNLCCFDLKSKRVKSYNSALAKLLKTNKYQFTALFQNSNKDIVIASAGFGALVLKKQTQTFVQYNSKNSGLASDYLNCISELSNKYLLFGSNVGVSCLNSSTNTSYNFNINTGFPLQSMIPGDIIRLQNGEYILSGVNGIAVLYETNFLSNKLPVKIYFSKLRVNNKDVSSNDSSGIITHSIKFAELIKLNHNENNIALEIGTNNFVNNSLTKYQYKLEGFNNEWIDFTPEVPIQYMNLPYGKYLLKVKAYQIQNQSECKEISVSIRVYPPWYLSWYAELIYLFLFLAISAWIIFFFKSRLLFRATLEAEHREKIRIEHINESKMRFFANISHELRTPLTIIIGQLELLLSQRLVPVVVKSISEIHTSASKMSALINELLDFLKYNQGDLRLKVSNQDIIPLIKKEYDSFLNYTSIRDIDFHFHFNDDPVFLYFDRTQLQKVFSNLLSNAIKYTQVKGFVSISIEQSSDSVRINVEDNGIGIAKDVQDKIFERFYQEENEINRDIATTGTGIGLSLAYNIVVAHGGTIKVESQIGKGSIFTVELFKGTAHLKKLENIEIIESSTISDLSESKFNIDEHRVFLEDIMEQQKSNFKFTQSILIVEDDEIIRKLLVQIFDPLFHVFEAENGEIGLNLAKDISPDLILSDVMMPKMSGKTLCTMIKSDFETCHIPVVLLTALSTIEDNISGLISGADAYITKPFNIKILVTECIGILNNRRRIQHKFKSTENISSSQIASNPMDQHFVDKSIKIIENSLESGSVDIGLLCTELAISRTKLFQKMKGITGLTPHEFIQNTKLKMAAKMLRDNPEYNISDIANNLGFSSLNYFGKSFKEFFGESPSGYRKSHINSLEV